MEQQNNQQKRDIWFGKNRDKYTDPKWMGKMGLIFAIIVILFRLLTVLVTGKGGPVIYIDGAPLIAGIIGTYFGIKKKAGGKIIFLNILVIILGLLALVSGILLETILK